MTYLDEHPDAAALGCRMIDGSGNFLPESKRGFPTPRVALFKSIGFDITFSKFEVLQWLLLRAFVRMDIHEVDVLTGAFMLLRKTILDEIGLLDEGFFMYGEDIDISYRIRRAGHKVIYYPHTTIIHFKGESTQKLSSTYVRRFTGRCRCLLKSIIQVSKVFFFDYFSSLASCCEELLLSWVDTCDDLDLLCSNGHS